MSEANPTVAPYAGNGEVVLRVTAHAADTEAARRLCDPVVEEIRSRLGAFVYGVDAGSLQKTAVALLKDKGMKIATAESWYRRHAVRPPYRGAGRFFGF